MKLPTASSWFKRGMTKQVGLAAVAVVGLLYILPMPPVYGHGESIEATPSEARPGTQVTVTGKGFEPGKEAELSLESARGSMPFGHA